VHGDNVFYFYYYGMRNLAGFMGLRTMNIEGVCGYKSSAVD
jgi:hypothetical protein